MHDHHNHPGEDTDPQKRDQHGEPPHVLPGIAHADVRRHGTREQHVKRDCAPLLYLGSRAGGAASHRALQAASSVSISQQRSRTTAGPSLIIVKTTRSPATARSVGKCLRIIFHLLECTHLQFTIVALHSNHFALAARLEEPLANFGSDPNHHEINCVHDEQQQRLIGRELRPAAGIPDKNTKRHEVEHHIPEQRTRLHHHILPRQYRANRRNQHKSNPAGADDSTHTKPGLPQHG
mmetsp:Transcript_93407/g.250157  ORF Transcript_93407/g.250157 Transcript_93407/m.250157 type:complete len:236 (+) Transcript_93407:557-1264(+)